MTLSTSQTAFAKLVELMREVFRTDWSSRLDLGSAAILHSVGTRCLEILIELALPISLAGFLAGALASFVQIGPIWSFDPMMPDLSKVDPLQGLLRLFSLKQLLENAKILAKTVVALMVSYTLVVNQIFQAPEYFSASPGFLIESYGRVSRTIFAKFVFVYGLFAVLDFFYQRFEFGKSVRQTKQQAKQEAKERDGDPQIRARIRSAQRAMARKRMMQAVKKADVVVTNPTHFAVALSYQRSDMSAPQVVAKGADFMAARIKAVASEAGVPLVENVALARALYSSVKIGQSIPRNLYQAVAEVLAYVYRLKTGSGGAP